MVLTYRVGKERNFVVALLLFLVTFGIYGIYWNYKAHQEVYRQFELDRDGREEGFLWLIFGFVLFQPLVWVYHWLFVGNVRYVRERLGFAKNLRVGTFLALSITGSVVVTIAFYTIAIAGSFLGEKPTDAEAATFMVVLMIAGFFALAALAMWVTAYALLQRELNQLWRAYDVRMMELTGGPPTGPPRPGVSAPAATSPPTMSSADAPDPVRPR